MSAPAAPETPQQRQELAARLRQERRSYIAGSLLVLAVVMITLPALFFLLLRGATPLTVANAQKRVAALQANMGWQQYLSEQLIFWAGGAGLFFLNFRFSLLIRRPTAAFTFTRSPVRALWWIALFMNSLVYTVIVPQLAITALLAHWGRQAIAELEAGGNAPPAIEGGTQ